jgi:hypothetical protein
LTQAFSAVENLDAGSMALVTLWNCGKTDPSNLIAKHLPQVISGGGFGEVLDFLPPEERNSFSPLLKLDGGAFLLAQLAEVTDKIEHFLAEMRSEYSDVAEAPAGDQETLRILNQERDILLELARTLRDEPRLLFFDLVSHRLERDHARIRDLNASFRVSGQDHTTYWKVETELTILNTLLNRWLEQVRELHDPQAEVD